MLAAPDSRELKGFGTINTQVAFDGTAALRADGGTLTITGAILDMGSFDAREGAILNITNAWNSGVANNVFVGGGEIKGGAITVANATGISGHGLVSSRIVNNSVLEANSGTLVFKTAANDNDWDGALGTGLLRALPGATLDVRDEGASFQFGGTVQVDAGARVFVNNPADLFNGVAFDFVSGSALNLNGGMYEAAASTDLEGTTTVAAGPESTIKVRNNTFLSFRSGSTTTLNGNLRLLNNNIGFDVGASFSGTGALIIDDDSHAVIGAGATVNALYVNEGTLRVANSEGIGVATVKDYVQLTTGELHLELTGTLPNQYDRLLASGIAQIDGKLDIDIDGSFVPALGNTFDIISTTFGVSGAFGYVDVSGMPVGRTFHVDYLSHAVRLTVVATPIFSADFDDDGDVDPTDLNIWRNAVNLNQLGDADGDNDSDGADFLIWQRQQGSHPVLPAGAPVPEPGALLLAGLAACGLTASRRRARAATPPSASGSARG